MASIGKLAKPAWIRMSPAEWDMLTESHQRKLISGGRASAESPSQVVAPPPSQEIHSPKAKELLARLAEAKEHTYALQQLWVSMEICSCAPDAVQFKLWFKHDFDTIGDSFYATAVWLSKLRNGEHPETADQKTHSDKIKYASAVMNNMALTVNQATKNQRFGDGTALPDDWDALDASEKRNLIAVHRGEA